MTAVLDAATALFAARGPASVSVRDIAAAARINHALVHRHFGSKDDVLRAVLERAAQEMAAITAEETNSRSRIARLFAASAEHEMYWRALARATLDGENPQALQREFPTIQRLIELLREEQYQARQRAPSSSSSLDVRVVVGTLSALTLGWLVFEPYLLAAAGLAQQDPKEVRQQVIQMLQMLIDRALAA
jgi:TetR/AcrR family transcriptional regulator, repressor for neighboring sulfatase